MKESYPRITGLSLVIVNITVTNDIFGVTFFQPEWDGGTVRFIRLTKESIHVRSYISLDKAIVNVPMMLIVLVMSIIPSFIL